MKVYSIVWRIEDLQTDLKMQYIIQQLKEFLPFGCNFLLSTNKWVTYYYTFCGHQETEEKYKINIGPVPIKDMQTPPLRNGHIYMKDAQCAETIEESTFRFLVFI